MRVLGMISGTSHDGIDCCLADFRLDGTQLRATVIAEQSFEYPDTLRSRLIAALPPAETTLAEVCELDTLIGQEFARCADQLITNNGGADAICSHGQTVFHWMADGVVYGTLQLGQPAWIAEKTGLPVVSDVRIRDITAGGQGAPLVSILDTLLLGSLARPGAPVAALNLGGISNMTVMGTDGVHAYDIGPSNALLDAAMVDTGRGRFDADGRIAASGVVDAELLEILLREPYYQLPWPKSTGKELFHIGHVQAALGRLGREISFENLMATLAELTVRTVATAMRTEGVTRLMVAGGGWHNPVIREGLMAALPQVEFIPAESLGLSVDLKEALAFALIGWASLHGLPGDVPGATGAASARILGTITPGRGPLVLPNPVTAAPTSLTIERA